MNKLARESLETRGAHNPAKAGATRRAEVRNDLLGLAAALEEQRDLENRLKEDIPEGTVTVELNISMTLAEQLEDSLRYAVRLI